MRCRVQGAGATPNMGTAHVTVMWLAYNRRSSLYTPSLDALNVTIIRFAHNKVAYLMHMIGS